MMQNPRCAGGFLWDLSDQGVVRTDKGAGYGMTMAEVQKMLDHKWLNKIEALGAPTLENLTPSEQERLDAFLKREGLRGFLTRLNLAEYTA